jgi:endo-1,4-beta-xylanase
MQTKSWTGVQAAILAGLMTVGLTAAAQAPKTLKDAYKGKFVVGAAINTPQINGTDAIGDPIIRQQFSTISPENALKWTSLHPQLDKYDFELADKYVAFGQENHMFIVGHCLVWHSQVPQWVFRDDKGELLTRDALLARMKEHIQTVVGRYKGKIQSWDVVNEALNEDGTMRQSMWYKIIGDDFIEKAFQYAHEADPAAQLNYNDYNLELPAKRAGAVKLIKKLKADGIPVANVGLQAHLSLKPGEGEDIEAAITDFAALGVKVAITELDINILPAPPQQAPTADVSAMFRPSNKPIDPALNPYVNGLPDEMQQQLASRYAELFRIFLKHSDAVKRVTLWGVTDKESWLNGFPMRGRTNYPLLFDREGKPKPAFFAVLNAAK